MCRSAAFTWALTVAVCASVAAAAKLGAQPNPPTWPSNVRVFGPSTPAATVAAAVNAAFAVNGGHDPANNGQFSGNRYAFLFEPGTYTTDVPVGFYTQVLGLGQSPDDVVFSGSKGVFCEEGSYVSSTGALDTFWRSAENFKTAATYKWATGTGMLWAVSQASYLRRVHVEQQLVLYEYQPPYQAAGYASGGYLSNSRVDNATVFGSQQQWFTRNSQLASTGPGVWNMVYTGVQGAPTAHCGRQGSSGSPAVVVDKTPVVAEKPFISVDATGKYSLNIPAVRRDSVSYDWSTGAVVDFSSVYVANNVSDTADSINAALSSGLHVVLTGGLYHLDKPLTIVKAGTVLMGLGWPTLIPSNGNAVVVVGNVPGVRIAGPILLQAGTTPTKSLLQWGDGSYAGEPTNPGIVYDTFARVGGPDTVPVQAEVMFQIDAGQVIIDDTWLWRADHTVKGIVTNSDNPCNHGLVVTGHNVTAYGLAAEHTLKDLVQWAGNDGEVHFFQSEMPYDVTQAQWGDAGYVGYRVNHTVTSHQAYGVGVYHYFRDYAVTVDTAISTPAALEANVVSPLCVFLNGRGTVQHIINSDGSQTPASGNGNGGQPAWLCPPQRARLAVL